MKRQTGSGLLSRLEEHRIVVLSGILALMLVNGVLSVRHKTITYDEADHYRYGLNILHFDSARFDDSKMPVTALNALPARVGELLPKGLLRTLLQELLVARVMTIFAALGLGVVIFRWAEMLYGFMPALLSLLLFALDPNIIAHSQLVTTDLYGAATITLATFCFWQFCERRDWKHAFMSAFTLALSQLAKYTAAYLLLIFPILFLTYDSRLLISYVRNRDGQSILIYLKKGVQFAVLFLIVGILVVNIGFLFNRTFIPFGDYQFQSGLFQSVQRHLRLIHGLPVPTPYPFLQGLDWVYFYERTGTNVAPIYLLGQLRVGGFAGYYLWAFLFKEPIATQILAVLSIILYGFYRKHFEFFRNEVFLLGPLFFFIVYFNFLFKGQTGFRFFIVALPVLFVFIGGQVGRWTGTIRWRKGVLGALLIYLTISVFSYYPYYLAYFNEIIWNRGMAYKFLADSNIDWGQSDWYLRKYVATHPDAHVEPDGPVAGTVIVSVNHLVGLRGAPLEKYTWLRDHFKPVDTIAYSYLVYQIPP
jgi:hypothetical protein